LVTYDILPTSTTTGFIECVQNAVDLRQIEASEESIDTYLEKANAEIFKPAQTQALFRSSTAAFCVLNWLLGLGDRHKGNMMVTVDGLLFHVDFGFILGEEPALKEMIGMTTRIRITRSVISYIERLEKTTGFHAFIRECVAIYLVLRRHYSLFGNLLQLVTQLQPPVDCKKSEDLLQEYMVTRFLPGTPDEQAKQYFETVLVNSIDSVVQKEEWVQSMLKHWNSFVRSLKWEDGEQQNTSGGSSLTSVSSSRW